MSYKLWLKAFTWKVGLMRKSLFDKKYIFEKQKYERENYDNVDFVAKCICVKGGINEKVTICYEIQNMRAKIMNTNLTFNFVAQCIYLEDRICEKFTLML